MNRRSVLKGTGLALSAGLLGIRPAVSRAENAQREVAGPIRVSLNENPYGPSPRVREAIENELGRVNRYADESAAEDLRAVIAAKEGVSSEQVVLGEILRLLGFYLAQQGGPGSEFLYSRPGYMALVDAAAAVGGVGVGVPLNARFTNDLDGLREKLSARTKAVYLVNPHNPTGTVSGKQEFLGFLREASKSAVAIVDEAYLEYTTDFEERTAAALVREGANVMVFRTLDKIHGLAGLPIGYVLAPRKLAEALHKEGAPDAEALGRLTLVAARAALGDPAQVARTRTVVAEERRKWHQFLDHLQLPHTDSQASFVFFDLGKPQIELATALRAQGIDIGRVHAPYINWARITIGLPEENRRVQQALGVFLRG